MDTSLINSEAVELLSRITGQKLDQRDLTPPVIFLAALITVLLGVMFADETISDEEKQRWQKTINHFIPPEGNVRQLTQLLSKGVRQNQIYKKTKELLILTAPLSESERLLLISFGYEMSAADGNTDLREKKYLELVANLLRVNPQYLAVLESGFSNQESVDITALNDVKSLLDPARFHNLDTVFVKAANNIIEALPVKQEKQVKQQHRNNSYAELEKFQIYKKELDNLCFQIFNIIKDCNDRDFLNNFLIGKIGKISQKLQSQKFRLSVVGEFSQGKSTFLNALLGQEIQPTRAIPCSGTVTVLKYGARTRVVCRYKDKNRQEEEIPVSQYQVKAAISEEAALNSDRDELSRSGIDEIIFEHPDLELCKNGVEIVDSPGLNECDDSTEITEKLLVNTDAVIFLANASRPLTKWESEKVKELKAKLNSGNTDEPANNLFVLVNFWDLLRREKDRQDVQQRITRFFQGQNPIIRGENRIHFISAQAALDAILKGLEDEYINAFNNFIQSLDKFLTTERGSLQISRFGTEIHTLIQEAIQGLYQAEDILNNKVKDYEAAKQEILEQIGTASGCDIRIKELVNQLTDKAIEESAKSWDEWTEGLGEQMENKSHDWHSEHSHIWSQKELIRDYTNQFIRDLHGELDKWVNTQLREIVLKQNLDFLDSEIRQELEALKRSFKLLDRQVNTNFSQQLNFTIKGIDGDMTGAGGFMGGIGAGGAFAAGLLAFTGVGLIPIIIAAVATAVTSSFGLGLLDVDGIHDQIKLKVFEQGFQKFSESTDRIWEKLGEIIGSAFSSRIEAAETAIEEIISSCENALELQDKAHKENQQQREVDKAFIAQKRQELEQVQKQLDAILNQMRG